MSYTILSDGSWSLFILYEAKKIRFGRIKALIGSSHAVVTEYGIRKIPPGDIFAYRERLWPLSKLEDAEFYEWGGEWRARVTETGFVKA